MTKKEILKLIKMKLLIINNTEILEIAKQYNSFIDEKHWFKKIDVLEEEFEILKSELRDTVKSVEIAQKEINKAKESGCDHKLRLDYKTLFTTYSECVLCGKTIDGDNVSDGSTIYNDINRNRNCVMLDGGCIDDDGNIFPKYTKIDAYKIIEEILKDKSEDENIDFINEFKKLNLDNCKIDERKHEKEYYILIIGGVNKQYINENQYITSINKLNSSEIAHFLCGIPKVKVELIDNPSTYETQTFNDKFTYRNISSFRFDNYESIDELHSKLEKEKNVPFDIIIDISTLIEYKDKNIIPYNLNYEKIFPNSEVIIISNSDIKNEKDLLKDLKSRLLCNNTHLQKVKKIINH